MHQSKDWKHSFNSCRHDFCSHKFFYYKKFFDEMQSFNTEKNFRQFKVFTSFTTLSLNKGSLNDSECTMNFKRIAIKGLFLKFTFMNSVALFILFFFCTWVFWLKCWGQLVLFLKHLFAINVLQLSRTLFSLRSVSSFFYISTA